MSDGELRGKVAVVTGGATGIGLAASLAFARAGAAVAVNYSKNAEAASAAVKEIGKLGVGAVAIRADVSNDGEVRAMLARVAKELGGVDILVNNAGWTKRVQPHSDLDGLTDDIWDRVWAVNVKGAFYCVRAATPHMGQRGAGSRRSWWTAASGRSARWKALRRADPQTSLSSAGFARATNVRAGPLRVTGGGCRGERRRSPLTSISPNPKITQAAKR